MVGEDGVPIGMTSGGSGFDFSMDPMAADDPELAMVRERESEWRFILNIYANFS